MNRSVLLVEDDHRIQQTLTDILVERGFAVTAASSLAEARRQKQPFAVALVDLQLPDGSGIHLARELRETRPDLDIVIVTANASLETAIDAVAMGAVRYLQKPCHPRLLVQVIDEIVERRSLKDEAQRQARRVQLVYDLLGQLVSTTDGATVATLGAEAVRSAADATAAVVVAATEADAPPSAWVAGDPCVELAAKLSDPTWLATLATTSPEPGVHLVPEVPNTWAACCVGAPSAFAILVQVGGVPADSRLIELMGRQIASAFQRATYHEQLQAAYLRLRATHATLIEAEKHSAVGRLAAGVAHEIGTPLNIISGRAETLLAKVEDASPLADGLRIIGRQIDRITVLVRQLLDYSRTESGDERAPIRLSAVLADTLPLVQTRAMQRKVTIQSRVPPINRTLHASFHQLQQVILNLVLNAVDADSKLITIDALVVKNGKSLLLTITDDGSGIPEEHLEMVFEPFFTTKARGEGTGLGLAVVRGIVRDHGGTIFAERVLSGGTRFSVELPLTPL